MKVLGIVGSPDGTTDVVERLAERLSKQGDVATVARLEDAPSVDEEELARGRRAGASVAHGVADEGWIAAGEDRSLPDVLDDLAPEFDYALVSGFPDADLPTVALGGVDHEGVAVESGATADDVDLDEVIEALRGVEPRETLESLVARAKRSPDAERSGAIATFTGRVRARDDPDDDPTEFLEFEKYEGVAEERMDRIAGELEAREGVFEVLMHHRTGVIEYGEDIVFVVVLAGHRKEAFRTVEDGIDRLKDEVPIFKREVTVEEEFWVHQRE